MKKSPEFSFEPESNKKTPLFSFKKKEKPDLSRFKKKEPSKKQRAANAEKYLEKQLRREKKEARRNAAQEKEATRESIVKRFSDEPKAVDTAIAQVESQEKVATQNKDVEVAAFQESIKEDVSNVITEEDMQSIKPAESAQEAVQKVVSGAEELFSLVPESEAVVRVDESVPQESLAQASEPAQEAPVQFANASADIEITPAPNDDVAKVNAIREQQKAQNEADKNEVNRLFNEMREDSDDGISQTSASGAIHPGMS